jgi:formylglycine-generating enzyme required for sulfatase activity
MCRAQPAWFAVYSLDRHPEGENRAKLLSALEYDCQILPYCQIPVTNVQWEAFIMADDGYRNSAWWRGIRYVGMKLWPFGGPEGCTAPTWSEANCPRESVSYFEAVAFCRWLSAKTRNSIRLPTDLEWMVAATGVDLSRDYPW